MRSLVRPGTYRPPRGGEPSRLREDGHWSTRDLVGYWPMNEGRGSVVQDVSPYGNHGTLTNMDPATDWVAGPDGAALDLDGSNDHIDCGNASAYQFGQTNSFSLCVRFNGAAPVGYYGDLIRKDLVTPRSWYLLRLEKTSNLLEFEIGDHSGNTCDVFSDVACNGAWHTAVAVRDVSADNIRLHIDGQQQADVAVDPTTAYNVNTGSLWLGGAERASSNNFDGLIQFVAIYSRALCADEISDLYAHPYLPLWRPSSTSRFWMYEAAGGGLPILGRTLGRTGPSMAGVS